MTKIQVFDTWENAFDQLIKQHYDKNLETRLEIHNVYKEKLQEYKESSGFNERYIKKREKELPRTSKMTHPKTGEEIEIVFPYSEHDLDPAHAPLPEEERKKFMELYPNIGERFELTRIIQLTVMAKEYFYDNVQDGLCPTSKYTNDDGYKTIPQLIGGVQELIQEQSGLYGGAKTDILFYTIDKETPLFTEEERREIAEEGFLEVPNLEEMPPLERAATEDKLEEVNRLVLKLAPESERGLTLKEMKEFEKLYFGN